MQHPRPRGPGARDRFGKALSNSTAESIRYRPRCPAQPLAGDLTEVVTADPPPWRALGPVVNVVVDDLYRFAVASS